MQVENGELAYRDQRQAQTRFAAVRVRVADGPPQRIGDKGPQHLPGDEAWLVGKHRSSGEKKYYRFSSLDVPPSPRLPSQLVRQEWIAQLLQLRQVLPEQQAARLSSPVGVWA